MYRLATRRVELALLVPVLLLVPARRRWSPTSPSPGVAEIGPMAVAIAFVLLIAAAHLALAWSGHRGDELLMPAAAALGAVGIVILNRLPQDLAGKSGPEPGHGGHPAGVVRRGPGCHGRRGGRPARRRIPPPLQVHLGAGRGPAVDHHLPVRDRDQRRAAVDRGRAVRLPAVGGDQGHARHLPGRLPGREPRRAGRCQPAPGAAHPAAAPVPRAHAGRVRRR